MGPPSELPRLAGARKKPWRSARTGLVGGVTAPILLSLAGLHLCRARLRFTRQSVDQASTVYDLATCRFIREAKDVLLVGPPGRSNRPAPTCPRPKSRPQKNQMQPFCPPARHSLPVRGKRNGPVCNGLPILALITIIQASKPRLLILPRLAAFNPPPDIPT
jgi:hypothetical protein